MMPFDAGGTIWTRHCVIMAWFPHLLFDVVMCCTQHVSQPGTKRALHSGTGLMISHLYRARDQKKMQHLGKCWIQLKEVQLQDNL